MAKRESVFADEWRRCLKEHYKYVIRKQDKDTEATLTPILEKFGFREDEFQRLKIEATMRAEDMPDDYVPDMEQFSEKSVEESKTPETTFTVHPAECNCPDCMDVVLEDGHDEEGQPIEEPEDEQKQDSPKQKSLF